MSRINKKCLNCGETFTIPQCRDWREHCCSGECKKNYRVKVVEEKRLLRKRECKICNKIFYPRQRQVENGQGICCSKECRGKLRTGFKANNETKIKQSIAIKKAKQIKPNPTGKEHPAWKGGSKAMVQRRIADGRANESVKKYRKNNPEKVREWAASRKRRKYGKLPRGTVADKLLKQKGLCAVCEIKLPKGYHVDHIYPLAGGGEHEPYNIQLLCPTCNTRKSAKDPIQFMQEMGKLL